MLMGIAATNRDSIFYYCYNERDFRVKGRDAIESQKIVEQIAASLNLELSILNPIPSHFEFQQGDLIDPFLLGRMIFPKGVIKPDLIGWNPDLYLKYSNLFKLRYPFKSYKVVKAWKKAECFKYYENLVLHPSTFSNSLSINNSKIIDKKSWELLIKSLTSENGFHEKFFGNFKQKELTLILLPHPNSTFINSQISELSHDLIRSQAIKQVIVKNHPNVDRPQTNFLNCDKLTQLTTYFFEPKEMPAEILVNYFENNFTLGVASGAHAENPPERAFILDSQSQKESKLWSLYCSKFYSLTGHRIESKAQISRRIRSLK
jgi:hypothetical protein